MKKIIDFIFMILYFAMSVASIVATIVFIGFVIVMMWMTKIVYLQPLLFGTVSVILAFIFIHLFADTYLERKSKSNKTN